MIEIIENFEPISKLGKILNKMQSEFRIPKNAQAKSGSFSYDYRTLDSIYVKIKDFLEKTPDVFAINNIEKYITDNGEFYLIAEVGIVGFGAKITSKTIIKPHDSKGRMNFCQEFGSTNTYALKYAWANLLLLEDEFDPDSNDFKKLEESKKKSVDESERIQLSSELNQKLNKLGFSNPEKVKFAQLHKTKESIDNLKYLLENVDSLAVDFLMKNRNQE